MTDPATELTRHDEAHGHYQDRPSLHDRLTAALHATLVDLHQPDIGHSGTGDVRHLEDDARTLAEVAAKVMSTDLAEATHFLIGPYRVAWQDFRKVWEVWPDPSLISLTRLDPPEAYPTRDAALARARQLAAE